MTLAKDATTVTGLSSPGLLDAVAHVQGAEPWGSLLDAGTGAQSLRWVASLATERWTAVSADPGHLDEAKAAVGPALRPQDRAIVGNWLDPGLLAGEVYDTVLAEYLVGAVEGYAPYFQTALFRRLRPHVGRRLYVIGLEPYANVPVERGPGGLVQEMGRLRDACALLAGQTPYREYPAEWVMDRIEETGLGITVAKRFPNRYGADWFRRQNRDVQALLSMIPDKTLAAALRKQAGGLLRRIEEECGRKGWIEHGSNYLIAAVPR